MIQFNTLLKKFVLDLILWSGVKMPEMQKLILFNLKLNYFENSY